jgi:hypothetical protein
MHPRDVTCVCGRSILLFVNRTLQHLIFETNLSPRVDTLINFYLKTYNLIDTNIFVTLLKVLYLIDL